MTSNKSLIERRQHDRFKVEDGTLAAFAGPPVTLGPIVDISMGGLAFCYTSKAPALKKPARLDILSGQSLSLLYGLPCETVYDIEIGSEMSQGPLSERRRGVRFGELTPGQRLQLQSFIENYAQNKITAEYPESSTGTGLSSSPMY
jgi:hypothetical protein